MFASANTTSIVESGGISEARIVILATVLSSLRKLVINEKAGVLEVDEEIVTVSLDARAESDVYRSLGLLSNIK